MSSVSNNDLDTTAINNELLKAVANRTNFDEEQVRLASTEFLTSKSPLVKEKLLATFTDAQDPDTRFQQTSKYLLNHLDEENGKAIAELICDLLMKDDPCFQALAFFNHFDYCHGEGEENRYRYIISRLPSSNYNWKLRFSANNPSFIHWNSRPYSNVSIDNNYLPIDYNYPSIDINNTSIDINYPSIDINNTYNLIGDNVIETIDNLAFDPEKLKYKFINIYLSYLRGMGRLNTLFPEPISHIDDLQPLFRRVLAKAGFLAFNVEAFRQQVNYFSRLPNYKESKFNLKKIIETLVPPSKEKKKMTQRKYWLWYVLVEKMIESGLKPRPAIKKAADILHEYTTSIYRMYYVMKKEAKSGKMSRDEIIRDFDLSGELNEFLLKAGVIET